MTRRRRDRITLRLSPISEEQTRFRLEGSMPTDLPPFALYQLFSLLVHWSGRPLRAVPSAGGSAGWLELWADALAGVPDPHVTVEFEATGERDDQGQRGPRR